MHAGTLRRLHDLVRVDLAQPRDVVGDGAGEQLDILRHIAEPGAEFFARPLREVDVVQPHDTCVGPPQAGQQAHQGRLAGTAGAGDGQ
ncbi:hypothetical protein D3C71_1389320 [compost metagenome]